MICQSTPDWSGLEQFAPVAIAHCHWQQNLIPAHQVRKLTEPKQDTQVPQQLLLPKIHKHIQQMIHIDHVSLPSTNMYSLPIT